MTIITESRYSNLKSKLNELHINIEQSNSQRVETLQKKIDNLDGSIESFHDDNVAKMNKLKQRFENIVKYIEGKSFSVYFLFKILKYSIADKLNCEEMINKKLDKVKEIETELLERVESEIQANREMEKRLTYFVLSNWFTNVSTSEGTQINLITVLSKQRYEEVERLKKLINDRLSRLNEQYNQVLKSREEADTVLLKRIDDECPSQSYSTNSNTLLKTNLSAGSQLLEMLEEQKKSISEAEEAMLEILRDMIMKIKADLDQERKEREENEETLLSLLEDTCYKLGAACSI